jgi:hypothetical protein
MKTFHCTSCQNLVFFENVRCLKCEHALAYLPDARVVAAIEQTAEGSWRSLLPGGKAQSVRLCTNYVEQNICNWAVPASDPESLCVSCRLTRVIPDLSRPANHTAWYRLETAKRRMLYSLLRLQLPLIPKSAAGDEGLAMRNVCSRGTTMV